MIKLLHIENIAVIEKADIEFALGLNVLTGETGAGKSIVIDALSAVTGGRTSREIIRTGADYATVTAVFSYDEGDSWLEDNNIDYDESGDVYITRRITSDGKTVCRINGTPLPVAQLREIGASLLDIHGQNDGRKLLDENAHCAYLDTFGDLGSVLGEYRELYSRLTSTRIEIDRLTMDESERERRIDALKYEVSEIEAAQIRIGEQEELNARRELLINASRLTEAVETAFEALHGGDSTDGAVALISEAQTGLERAAHYSEGLRAICERLSDLRYSAQDISDELRAFRSELDFFPGELEELEARLDLINRIIRKYGSEEDALEQLEQGELELASIEDSSHIVERLSNELDFFIKEALSVSAKLSQTRREVAKLLENQVMDELTQLNMPGVKFVVEFSEVKGEYGINANGQDEVRFLMSANAGETPGRINRIASGGELARIMLALKSVVGSNRDTGTVVFDEIDSGVSGIAAQRVGEKLSKLARLRQVLCVTHLPQIAAMADTHFEILKNTSDGRTYTQVNELDLEGRKNELARLSGGENITETTLSSAAEQLEAAEKYKMGLEKRH